MKRVLVTGATGFIGRHSLAPLIDRDYEVHAVARSTPDRPEPSLESVCWHAVDLLDLKSTDRLCRTVQASHLLHFAWYVEHGKFWHSSENEIWLDASKNLLRHFKDAGGTRAVVAGTCAEYKIGDEPILSEKHAALDPQSLYGRAKVELQQYLASTGLSWAWGRIFFLFGEFESDKRLVASVINSLLNNEPANCTHGNQVRDFLYVRDVASAFAALIDSDVDGPVNIGSGKRTTIKEVVCEIAELISIRDNIRFGAIPSPPGEPPSIIADISRLRDEVGWTPTYTLQEGLAETIEWWKNRSKY